ncbi:MAG: hypothetical protein OEZ25_01890 [Candidatus Bathyarchaeota archaeon]|nr:hypothetical protein [Candidatus Bathyarchaeota archaeon]
MENKKLIGIDLDTTRIKVDSCDLKGNLLGSGNKIKPGAIDVK